MSWWDYGYQITAMANRTILVDNNTWNNTHISRVGQVSSFNLILFVLYIILYTISQKFEKKCASDSNFTLRSWDLWFAVHSRLISIHSAAINVVYWAAFFRLWKHWRLKIGLFSVSSDVTHRWLPVNMCYLTMIMVCSVRSKTNVLRDILKKKYGKFSFVKCTLFYPN